ncbi:MAG: sensor histidine kinase [Ferruginibacter sp.]
MKPAICILTLFLYFFVLPGKAQTRIIDSLKRNIRAATSNEEKIRTIFSLCDLGYTLHPDTLMQYAENGKKIAIQLNDLHDEVNAMYYETGALTTKGLLDSSLNLANKCLEILSSKLNDPIMKANLLNQKGRCYVRKNQYKEAIDMAYQVITLGEKNKDVLLQVKAKTLIGWAYLEMGQLKEALNWHLKALYTTSDTILLEKYAILFANLATNYNGIGKTDSAFYFINKGIRFARKYENLFALSNCLAIQSELYVKSGQARLSEPILKEVIDIRKTIGDPFYIASDMSQLGFYYAHYGQPEKGIAICNEGIAIAKKYNLDTKLFFLYGSLADNYKALGNTSKYAEVLENIIDLKDSVYQKNSAEALAEMQTKYDLQRKENLIIQQKLDIQQKNYLFYGSLLLLFFTAFIGWFVFREYKRRQKIKLEKMQEEEKILSVIAVTKAEEHERKRIAADLHDNIGAYASAIRADVEKITDNGLEKNTGSLQNLQQHSQEIIDSLRDTIWVLNKENITITGISDRIKNYLNKLQPSYSHIQFHVYEEIKNDIRISSQNALNIFRIVQEAIHNSLKHSNASNINISINSTEHILIKIEDDGKGMKETQEFTEGNGLLNMKARANEGGFQLHLSSRPGRGTTVLLEFATTN